MIASAEEFPFAPCISNLAGPQLDLMDLGVHSAPLDMNPSDPQQKEAVHISPHPVSVNTIRFLQQLQVIYRFLLHRVYDIQCNAYRLYKVNDQSNEICQHLQKY